MGRQNRITGKAVLTVVVGTGPWLLYGLYALSEPPMRACMADAGLSVEAAGSTSGPCSRELLTVGLLALAFWAALGVGIVTGLVAGWRRGRRRRPLARPWWAALVATPLAPVLSAGWSVGWFAGRLAPRLRAHPRSAVEERYDLGLRSAVALYRHLAAGGEPAHALSDMTLMLDGPVRLDTCMTYGRWYGVAMTVHGGGLVALGSPAVVTGALIGNAVGRAAAQSRARRESVPQWRERRPVRVVVTDASVWCSVDGRWLQFPHAAFVTAELVHERVLVLTFPDTEPLALDGAEAPYLGVLVARGRLGPLWQEATWLAGVKHAALVQGPEEGDGESTSAAHRS